jgi:hypothetical protein
MMPLRVLRRPGASAPPARAATTACIALLVLAAVAPPPVAATTKWVRETTGSTGPGDRSGAAGLILTNNDLFVAGGESGPGR